jgi:hypothetical protein
MLMVESGQEGRFELLRTGTGLWKVFLFFLTGKRKRKHRNKVIS